MTLTVLNTVQRRKYGLLCYTPNVKMHFQNDIRTGWLFVHMSTLDATLSSISVPKVLVFKKSKIHTTADYVPYEYSCLPCLLLQENE